jgi:hypothetical protein
MTSSQIITKVFSTAWSSVFSEERFNMSIEDYFRYVIRGYATFINEKISNYFTFLLDKKIYMADITKMSPIEQTKLRNKLKIIISIEMELAFNPNALDDKIKLLKDKNYYKQYLNTAEYFKISNEIITLEQYRNHINDFNSPINTPSSSTSKSSTSKSSTSKSSTPISIKKTKTRTIKRKEEKICPPGKELNPKTNRCIKIKPVSIMKILKDQKKKLEEELSKKTKECPPGKELNQITGRCNKIKTRTLKIKKEKPKKESLNKPKECPTGKELNLKTNRCVKIKTKTLKK